MVVVKWQRRWWFSGGTSQMSIKLTEVAPIEPVVRPIGFTNITREHAAFIRRREGEVELVVVGVMGD